MKTGKRRIVFIALLFLVSIPIIFFRLYTFTFSNFIVDESAITVFYPEGVANGYKGITIISPNEDHRIWKYKLNNKEIEKINNDLSIDVWQMVSNEETKFIKEVYFNGFLFDYKESDEIFYCLNDFDKGIYYNIDIHNTLLYCQENLLLVYNKTTSEYYCVSKIVHWY